VTEADWLTRARDSRCAEAPKTHSPSTHVLASCSHSWLMQFITVFCKLLKHSFVSYNIFIDIFESSFFDIFVAINYSPIYQYILL
jgi:hypothetical protein